MSYLRNIKYRVIPIESYKVIRNCPGCGGKTFYCNTNNFRVNANGNRIDIWLIYQCEICKHTFNLSIYERIKPEDIPYYLYESFQKNEIQTARKYGIDKSIFSRNKAIIEEKSMNYKIERVYDEEETGSNLKRVSKDILIEIENSYGMKVRVERMVAQVLKLSRTRVKKLEKLGKIEMETEDWNHKIKIRINGDEVNEWKLE